MLQEGPRPLRKPGTRRYYRGRFQKSNLLRRPANQSRRKTQMDEPLHPSGLSEILDRTAQIYRSRFLVFLGIAVIPTAVLVVFAGCGILVYRFSGLHTATALAGLPAVLALAALGLIAL